MQSRLMLDLESIINRKLTFSESEELLDISQRAFEMLEAILNEIMQFDDVLRYTWGIEDEKIYLMNIFTSAEVFQYWYSGDLALFQSMIKQAPENHSTVQIKDSMNDRNSI